MPRSISGATNVNNVIINVMQLSIYKKLFISPFEINSRIENSYKYFRFN